MPQTSSDFRVWTIKIKPGIYFAERPGVQGQEARARRAGLRLLLQALRRPGQQEPGRGRRSRPTGIVGLNELRQAGLDKKQPFDYDREIEGLRALDRYTLQIKLEEPRPRFVETPGRQRPPRRGGARGGRVLRRQGRGAPGRHRPVQARAVAAQLVHRVRAQPRLPRDVLRRRARGRRRRRPGAAGALQGPAPADGRPGRDLGDRRRPAALAVVRQRRGRPRLPHRLPVREPGDARRQGGAEPGQARPARLPGGRAGQQLPDLQHGRPDRRRLQRREGGAAPRGRPGHGHRQRNRLRLQRPGRGGAVGVAAVHLGLRPQVQERVRRLRPGARESPARPLRLQGQGRRRLARHARRFAAGAQHRDRSRPAPAQDHGDHEQEHEGARHPHRIEDRASGPRT